MPYNDATNLGPPQQSYLVDAKYTLVQFFPLRASDASGLITPVNITGGQDLSVGALPISSDKTYHMAGGDQAFEDQDFSGEWSGTLTILEGVAQTFMMAALGIATWDDSGTGMAAINRGRFPTHPIGDICAVLRKNDDSIIKKVLLPQIKITGAPVSLSINSKAAVQFSITSQWGALDLPPGVQYNVERFAGDGSTASFTLAAAAVDLLDSSKEEYALYALDDLVYVREFTSTEQYGKIVKDLTLGTGTALAVGSALAAGTSIDVGYVIKQS